MTVHGYNNYTAVKLDDYVLLHVPTCVVIRFCNSLHVLLFRLQKTKHNAILGHNSVTVTMEPVRDPAVMPTVCS